MPNYVINIALRLVLAVVAGGLIGAERARHGRAAGMRTHILVCLGAALTSLTSLCVSEMLHTNGDVFRMSSQVISGIGFLGAGMIILKNDNTIMGLTTAAGVWTSATIGIALGYGFYIGAGIATVLFLVTITLLSNFERNKKVVDRIVYAEVDDMSKLNSVISKLRDIFLLQLSYKVMPSISGTQNHVGLELHISDFSEDYLQKITEIENIIFAVDN